MTAKKTVLILEQCQKTIGYKFKDPQLLETALHHASIADDRRNSNERLEFLGDAVLGLVVCHELFQRFPDYLEGPLTKVKSMLVSRRTCAKITDGMGLAQFLKVGKGMGSVSKLPMSCRAAALESIIGAIYLDGGKQAAHRFIVKQFKQLLEVADASEHQENFKSMLQQHAQRVLDITPAYDVLDEKGPDHSKCFEVAVAMGSTRYPSAWGPSKKEAEQTAAFYALRELEVLPRDAQFPDLKSLA
jgi:ribonuclease-3